MSTEKCNYAIGNRTHNLPACSIVLQPTMLPHASNIYVREPPICFCLPDSWLEVSVRPEGPATGRLNTRFLGFLRLQAKAEMVSRFQVTTMCF
jgi:hypothetical protein